MPIEDVIKAVVIMLAVILAAYYATKFLSVRTRAFSKSKYMKVKDVVSVGRDKNIVLIEAAGKYHMVGITPQSMQALASFEKEELKELDEGTGIPKAGFSDFLKRCMQAPQALAKAREEALSQRESQSTGQPAQGQGENSVTGEEEIAQMMRSIHKRHRKKYNWN